MIGRDQLRALATLLLTTVAPAAESHRFDVVIAGGSTAAIAAAFAAADEGATVALLEPTDWIGGQLTASGVPAVDEAWHKITDPRGHVLLDVAAIARDPRNMTPEFRDALQEIGNPGDGWVSRYCFEPRTLLRNWLLPRERELSNGLKIFRETVVKRVEVNGGRVRALHAVQRRARAGVDPYARLPSQDLPDWYSPADSDRFTKRLLRFTGAVFIDATEWGEVLALSGASYLQGAEINEDTLESDDRLGQATVYGFVQEIHPEPVADRTPIAQGEGLGFGPYRDRDNAWPRIWTYRRIRGSGPEAAPGDLSLQNWGYSADLREGGNDYPFGYLLLPKRETSAQRADWRGGVDLATLAGAERRALAWHEWFRHAAPADIDPDQITLSPDVFGAAHGLAKLPYVRDTRRSIGVGGFVLKLRDLTAPIVDGRLQRRTGEEFPDRVALGAYPADIHPLDGYEYPPSVHENHPTAPFYIPLRSLTNEDLSNLLVAGKTIAQTFLANAATRLHPIEWSTGTACGVVAADLAVTGDTTEQACADFERLRRAIARYTPVDWTLPEGESEQD